jgi:ElaA protein
MILLLRDATTNEMVSRTLYALLRLRTDVFVVEQKCAYAELDGRDNEPGTRHFWLAPDDDAADVHAYLRTLVELDDTLRIGRVCTHAKHRGQGLSTRLMESVLATHDGPVMLDAQSHLAEFYTRFGFAPSGPEYVEDGIAHVPMLKPR